jgi:predicted nucleic acid-binding protein
MRIYLDTNLFIPAVEGRGPLRDVIGKLLGMADENAGLFVTSELTLAEVLVVPFEKNQENVIATYLELIHSRPGLDVISVDREILVLAARIRAGSKRTRLPDAIHLAPAQVTGCSCLLSGDTGLKTTGEIRRIPTTVESIAHLIGQVS